MNDHLKNPTTSTFNNCCKTEKKNLFTSIQSNKKKSSINTYKKFSLLICRSFLKSKNSNTKNYSSNSLIAKNIQLPIKNINNNMQNNNLNQNKTNLSFIQRIKLHKDFRTGNISEEMLKKKLPLKKESKKIDAFNYNIAKKKLSLDVPYEVNKTTYITEALFALADSQPIVARSTPKHATSLELIYNSTISEKNLNKKKIEERLKKNCIYETNVYDQMLDDSLLICNMLQTHLNDCINGVRAQSPNILTSPFTSPSTTPILPKAQSSQLLNYEKNNSILSLNEKNSTTKFFNNQKQKIENEKITFKNNLKQNNNIKKKDKTSQSNNLPPLPKTKSLFLNNT